MNKKYVIIEPSEGGNAYMDFIRGIIRWIIIAIIIILVIALIGHFANKQKTNPVEDLNSGLRTIENNVESEFDDGLEAIDNTIDNTINTVREEDRVELQTIENAPDTASSNLTETIFGLIILSTGTYYIYKAKSNS